MQEGVSVRRLFLDRCDMQFFASPLIHKGSTSVDDLVGVAAGTI
jgi:hypothetical protein